MKNILAILFSLAAGYNCWSQQTQKPVLSRILVSREKMTIPPYGLKKVERIIKTGSDKDCESLSLRGKYTYNMIHGEQFSQICSTPPIYPAADKKIFAFLVPLFIERSWSSRQLAFFKHNKDSVIDLMTMDIRQQKEIGLNFKHVIIEINAVSMIPLLISTYRSTQDHDILTVLSLLMKANKYGPYTRSFDCKELYAGTQSYYLASLIFNSSNEAFIIQRATDFYNSTRPQVGDGFVLVPKGRYTIGKSQFLQNPLRKVRVDSFYIAVYETTNRQFAAFIAATAYRTDAERRHDALVFVPGLAEFRWLQDSTACWRYPNGVTRGGIDKKMDHPVTCISYSDILAYCRWACVRLPTLEEWEIACRAGATTDYFFGDNDSAIGRYANIWHLHDHLHADSSDGYMYTAPVGSFAPNPWGLYDMYGNVFEFCTGKLTPDESAHTAHARGGSWWCSAASCHFFNSYDIGSINIHASFSNQGFRVVRL